MSSADCTCSLKFTPNPFSIVCEPVPCVCAVYTLYQKTRKSHFVVVSAEKNKIFYTKFFFFSLELTPNGSVVYQNARV